MGNLLWVNFGYEQLIAKTLATFCGLVTGSSESDGARPSLEVFTLSWNLLSVTGLLNKDPKSIKISSQIFFFNFMDMRESRGRVTEWYG